MCAAPNKSSGKRLHLLVDWPTYQALKVAAEVNDRPVSAEIRVAIRKHLRVERVAA
jgi:hypothetical protein